MDQERKQGHSALRGKPTDENGGIELQKFDPHSASPAQGETPLTDKFLEGIPNSTQWYVFACDLERTVAGLREELAEKERLRAMIAERELDERYKRQEAEQQLAEAQKETKRYEGLFQQAVDSWHRDSNRMDWLLHELREREDVRDGADGQQLPNEAMSILSAFDERFPNSKALQQARGR